MGMPHSRYDEAPRIEVDAATCKGCRLCVRVCPADVLVWNGGRVSVDPAAPLGCIACGHCMMVCPEGSIGVRGRGLSPEDLTDLPAADARASADALEALLLARRSVRRFHPGEVSRELLERVVNLSAQAPMGIPPWDVGVVVVAGREKVQNLAAEIARGYEGFLRLFRPWVLVLMRPLLGGAGYSLFRRFVTPLARTIVDERRRGRDVLFWDAPAVLIFHHSPYSSAIDSNIACTHAMLAAEALGLGSTVIGSAPPILQRNKRLLESYGIPKGHKPAQALILGHPAVPFRRAVRRRFNGVRFV